MLHFHCVAAAAGFLSAPDVDPPGLAVEQATQTLESALFDTKQASHFHCVELGWAAAPHIPVNLLLGEEAQPAVVVPENKIWRND